MIRQEELSAQPVFFGKQEFTTTEFPLERLLCLVLASEKSEAETLTHEEMAVLWYVLSLSGSPFLFFAPLWPTNKALYLLKAKTDTSLSE